MRPCLVYLWLLSGCVSGLKESDLDSPANDDSLPADDGEKRDAQTPPVDDDDVMPGDEDGGPTPPPDCVTRGDCPPEPEPQCGNKMLEKGETCDDGGESANCNEDCTASTCGDGVVNASAGETCDTKGASEVCTADCISPSCGDGKVDELAGETCDTQGESASCNANCRAADCGDGQLNVSAGEKCDDGKESATCDLDCTPPACGDGTPNAAAGEACDGGSETAECDADCTLVECGDGVLNITAQEACETPGSLGCSAECKVVSTAVVVTGGSASLEDTVITRLRSSGLAVQSIDQAEVTLDSVANFGLVVVTAAADAGVLGAKLADTPRPLLILEPGLFEPNGFGESKKSGVTRKVSVVAQHPLGAGVTGLVDVWSTGIEPSGVFSRSSMLQVATAASITTTYYIFGYEAQSRMIVRVAAARRVGFVPGAEPQKLTEQGWLLFDAAVNWLRSPPVPLYDSCTKLMSAHPALPNGLYALRKNNVDTTEVCVR